MMIEAKVTGLTKAKRNKLTGLRSYDEATELATFEWAADADAPHDYPTAMHRVRDEVTAAGGEASGYRLVG